MDSFESTAGCLGIRNAPSRIRENWEKSQSEYPGPARVFHGSTRLLESCRYLAMPDPFADAVRQALPVVAGNEALSRYLWHCRWLLSSPLSPWPSMGGSFPAIPAAAPAAGMGYALVFLDLFPLALKQYRERGVEEGVIRDTMADFSRWVGEYRKKNADWGLSNLGWMQHHLRGRIFKLGRLQFKAESYWLDFHVWRHRASGRVLVLAGSGMIFRPDGHFADADRAVEPPPGAWQAVYEERADTIRGMPSDPRGRMWPNPVELERAEWMPVLGRGDPTIGIHIPAGSPMDFDACGESLSRAAPFFARHMPEHPAKALTCGSWLLDPQFEGRLPDTSNTVRFLREMYLHPLPGANDSALMDRVFSGGPPPPDVPETGMTTMQKAVIRHIRSGGKWRVGASLLIPRDLNWGAQVYRAMWPEGRLAEGRITAV